MIKKSLKDVIINGLKFAACFVTLFLLLLFPLIRNILRSDFSSSYQAYYGFSLGKEFSNQVGYFGTLWWGLMVIGIIYGLLNKHLRKITITSIVQYLMIILWFHKTQGMGSHHLLLLTCSYFYFTFLFVLFVNSLSSKKIRVLMMCISGVIIFANLIVSLLPKEESKAFTDIKLYTPEQTDYDQMSQVAYWLKENLNSEHTAYMIPHNESYNPDKFRNFFAPDLSLRDFLPYGSAILGTHKFPTELFTATYIITTSPYEPLSVDERYEKTFEDLVQEGVFSQIEDFNMNNGYRILVFERVKPFTKDEAMLYLNNLTDLDATFPNLYSEVVTDFLNKSSD